VTAALESQLRAAAAVVEEVARAVTGASSAIVGPWTVEDLAQGFGNPTSGGVVRVAGTARLYGREAPWSAVLKVLHSPEGPQAHDSPTDPIYWRRELDLARSGLLTRIVGLGAPRCYRVDEPDLRTGWLWLEDLGRLDREPWRESDYRAAARALARYHSATIGLPGPQRQPWLERPSFVAFLAQECRPWSDAMLAEVDGQAAGYEPLASPDLAAVLDLVRDPAPVLRTASRVPPAVCHNDFNPDNLVLRRAPDGHDELVAFDWQMIGTAPVSSDLSQLLCYLPLRLEGRPRTEVERSVVEEYAAALAESGFVLEPDVVEAAQVADGAARQAMFFLGVLWWELAALGSDADADARRAVVARHVGSLLAGPVPDLARRALEHARADPTEGWFAYGTPPRPGDTS
jgi:hypothetical protein